MFEFDIGFSSNSGFRNGLTKAQAKNWTEFDRLIEGLEWSESFRAVDWRVDQRNKVESESVLQFILQINILGSIISVWAWDWDPKTWLRVNLEKLTAI